MLGGMGVETLFFYSVFTPLLTFSSSLSLGGFEVFAHHFGYQFFETDFWDPSELLQGFGGIAQEGLSSEWTFMVEENTIAGIDTIRLTVVHRNPVSIELSNTIRTSWIKQSGLPTTYSLLAPA